MVQLLRMCIETEHDAPCALSKGELSEAETEELLPAWKCSHAMIPRVGINAFFKLVTGKNIRELTKNECAVVHAKWGKCGLIFPDPIEVLKKVS